MGFGPLAWPNQPDWSNPTGQVLGRSNRPRPASVSHLSPSTLSPATPKSPPPSPGDSGRFWRVSPPPPRAKCSPLDPLLPPPSRFASCFLTEEIRGVIPLGNTTCWRRRTGFVTSFSWCWLRPSVVVMVKLCGWFGWWPSRRESKHPRWVCSSCLHRRSGKDFPRSRLVGRASPASPC
jgi:hypothetical protein